MSKSERATASDPLARHWARKGSDELDMIEATLTLARQLLASGEVQPYGKGENPFELAPYTWETAETPAEAQRRIFLGTVSERPRAKVTRSGLRLVLPGMKTSSAGNLLLISDMFWPMAQRSVRAWGTSPCREHSFRRHCDRS